MRAKINRKAFGKKTIKLFKFNERAYCINLLGLGIWLYDKKYNIQ